MKNELKGDDLLNAAADLAIVVITAMGNPRSGIIDAEDAVFECLEENYMIFKKGGLVDEKV